MLAGPFALGCTPKNEETKGFALALALMLVGLVRTPSPVLDGVPVLCTLAGVGVPESGSGGTLGKSSW